jgi:hypothetical protein
MIDYHRFCQIKDLHDHQELNATQIAGVLSLCSLTHSNYPGTPIVAKQGPFSL